jgi:YD repeat-containing protein
MRAHIPKTILMTSKTALRRAMCMVMLIISLVVNVGSLAADQAQYYYDELGRLVGVVNAQGEAAVYHYDAVGNLLSIQRFTSSSGSVGVFLVTPGSSIVNKPVEIRGFGFTTPPSSNQVSFNGTAAAVISGTVSSLIVTVPTGATTGPVAVTNANGIATSPQAFTVLVPPIIVNVLPSHLPQGTAMQVTIGGFNVGNAASVTFTQAGLSAIVGAGSTDQNLNATITVGAAVPPGAYTFAVTTPGGTAQSGSVTITVAIPVPSAVIGKTSVYKPFPPTVTPSGPTSSNNATSVFKPMPSPIAPFGESSVVAPSTSVSMP